MKVKSDPIVRLFYFIIELSRLKREKPGEPGKKQIAGRITSGVKPMRLDSLMTVPAGAENRFLMIILFAVLLFLPASGQTTGGNGSHDPSRMVEPTFLTYFC
jgi:hypothetical protein